MFFIKITLRVNAENLKELNEKSKMLRDEFANRYRNYTSKRYKSIW